MTLLRQSDAGVRAWIKEDNPTIVKKIGGKTDPKCGRMRAIPRRKRLAA